MAPSSRRQLQDSGSPKAMAAGDYPSNMASRMRIAKRLQSPFTDIFDKFQAELFSLLRDYVELNALSQSPRAVALARTRGYTL